MGCHPYEIQAPIGNCISELWILIQCGDEKKTYSSFHPFPFFDSGISHLLRGQRDLSPSSPSEGVGPDQGDEHQSGGGKSEVKRRGKAVTA